MSDELERKKAIAARMAAARENAGLSQGQAAKLMGMHRPTISEIEAGRRSVKTEELARFAGIYQVDFEWLGCSESDPMDENRARLQLAARELTKLKQDDLDKVIELLIALKPRNDEADES